MKNPFRNSFNSTSGGSIDPSGDGKIILPGDSWGDYGGGLGEHILWETFNVVEALFTASVIHDWAARYEMNRRNGLGVMNARRDQSGLYNRFHQAGQSTTVSLPPEQSCELLCDLWR
jgi:hypothetical protein